MPAYNAAAYIAKAICSVQAQTYANWELIVVDDGSTDDTAGIVKTIQHKDDRVNYHYQTNQRLGAARNTGIKLAKGNWVGFLDADDIWLNNKLQIQIDAARDSQVDVIFSAGYYLHADEPILRSYDSLVGAFTGTDLYQLILKHNHIAVLSVLIKKHAIEQVGLQDTYPLAFGNEDWDYWLRTCRLNFRFLGLRERLFEYRVHANGMSTANRMSMHIGSFYVICKNYDKRLLDKGERKYHQLKLRTAIPFMLKRALKAPSARLALSYTKLTLKMALISSEL